MSFPVHTNLGTSLPPISRIFFQPLLILNAQLDCASSYLFMCLSHADDTLHLSGSASSYLLICLIHGDPGFSTSYVPGSASSYLLMCLIHADPRFRLSESASSYLLISLIHAFMLILASPLSLRECVFLPLYVLDSC